MSFATRMFDTENHPRFYRGRSQSLRRSGCPDQSFQRDYFEDDRYAEDHVHSGRQTFRRRSLSRRGSQSYAENRYIETRQIPQFSISGKPYQRMSEMTEFPDRYGNLRLSRNMNYNLPLDNHFGDNYNMGNHTREPYHRPANYYHGSRNHSLDRPVNGSYPFGEEIMRDYDRYGFNQDS